MKEGSKERRWLPPFRVRSAKVRGLSPVLTLHLLLPLLVTLTLTMKKLSVLFILLISSSGLSSLISGPLPRELLLERDPSSGTCSLIAQRDTQIFRKLPQDGSHVSRQETVNGRERLSVIAQDDVHSWARAYTLCTSFGGPAPQSHDPTRLAAQDVLSISSIQTVDDEPVKGPPLEVEPLILSGASSNRVDLVFFSDGCKHSSMIKFV